MFPASPAFTPSAFRFCVLVAVVSWGVADAAGGCVLTCSMCLGMTCVRLALLGVAVPGVSIVLVLAESCVQRRAGLWAGEGQSAGCVCFCCAVFVVVCL